MVAPWYTDPVWQNMLLFPWMDEEALLLSEVYTAIEIESLLGSGKKRQLKDYREVFKEIKSEGTRILVKGDPGIGKTTFTHKVAFDWATGCLDLFDVVLVVKLKLADCNQTIESLVKEQLGSVRDNDATDSLIGEYLRSGQDRVLLVLDGLDEINLRQYPNIQDVLNGKSFRKCCILATTRPYVARELKGKMTSVAHLKGFSRLKAEKFITHIIIDQVERKRFFTQLDRRRMSHMHKVPLIVQALALLFNEDQELPETFTTTYDELVFFLRKTCEDSKGLTEEEIRAAMDEVNQLAFKGLTRDDKQLVFSRDEVKNDNIYKLGLLSAEKTGSGFRPTTVLQFAHATIQENCGADHVVRRLEANDRGPWNTIVQLFHKTFTTNVEEVPEREQNITEEATQPGHTAEEEVTQTGLLTNAVEKIWSAISRHPNRNAAIVHMLKTLMNVGAFDAELDIANMWEEYSKYPLVADNLNEAEKEAMFDFIAQELLVDTTPEWRAQQKAWVEGLTEQYDQILFTYFMGVQQVVNWVKEDPDMAKQKLRDMAAVFTAQGNLPTQSVSQDFTHLWDHLGSYKTLFRFIIGKLSPKLMQDILLEIAALAVQHSFDKNNGGVLPFYLLKSLIEDLMKESKSTNDNSSFCGSPVLMHLDGKQTAVSMQPSHENSALKISGTGRDTVNFIMSLTERLGEMTNIRTVEIEDMLFDQCPVERSDDFVRALYQSPIVSLELRNLDSGLINLLTLNLPLSAQRLSISRSPVPYSYRLPPIVNLVCLYLEDCTASIANMVAADFPKLKKLVIINTNAYCHGDALAIHRAIQSGRMPKLEDINIRFGQLSGFGQQIVEILSQTTMRTAELVGGNLVLQDGSVLLRFIQEGHLDHIRSLNLTNNEDLGPLLDELKVACTLHNIHLEVSPAQKEPLSSLPYPLNLLQLMNPQATSTGGATMTTTTPTLDLGALVTNFAPLLTSAARAQSRGPTQGPTSGSGPAVDIGNVLLSAFSPTSTSPQTATMQPRGGTPNQGPPTASGVGFNIGNVLSSVLGTTDVSQLAVPNLTGGQARQSTTVPNLTGGQARQSTTVPNLTGGQARQSTTVPNLTGGQARQSTTVPNLTGGQASQSPSTGSGDGFDLGNILSTVLGTPDPSCCTRSNFRAPDPPQPATASSNLNQSSTNSAQQTKPDFNAMLSTFFNSTSTPTGNSGYIDEDVE